MENKTQNMFVTSSPTVWNNQNKNFRDNISLAKYDLLMYSFLFLFLFTLTGIILILFKKISLERNIYLKRLKSDYSNHSAYM